MPLRAQAFTEGAYEGIGIVYSTYLVWPIGSVEVDGKPFGDSEEDRLAILHPEMGPLGRTSRLQRGDNEFLHCRGVSFDGKVDFAERWFPVAVELGAGRGDPAARCPSCEHLPQRLGIAFTAVEGPPPAGGSLCTRSPP